MEGPQPGFRGGHSRLHWVAFAGLLVITLAGTAIRLRIASTEPMWRDEAQTIAIASRSFPAGIVRALARDGNSPLFYLAQHFLIAPRDVPFRELRDRIISVTLGVALIPLSFLLGRSLGGGSARAGLTLSAWIAFAPIVVDAATQARPYSALMLAVTLLVLATLRVVRSNGGWAWYAAAAVSVLYLHTLAATVVAATGIALLFVIRRKGSIRQWLLWHIITVVAWVPGLMLVATQVRELTVSGRIPWGSATRLSDLPSHLLVLLSGAAGGTLQPLVGWAMCGLFLGAMVIAAPQVRMMGSLAILALLIAVALSWVSAGLVTRYSLPIAALLVAPACTAFRKMPAVASAAFIALYFAFSATNGDFTTGQRSSSRVTAEQIVKASRPGDLLLIVPDTLAVAVNYYLPPKLEQLDLPSLSRVESVDFAGWEARYSEPSRLVALRARLASARETGRRVWLVVWLPATASLPPRMADNALLVRQWAFSRAVRAEFDRYYLAPRLTRIEQSREGVAITLGEPKAQ